MWIDSNPVFWAMLSEESWRWVNKRQTRRYTGHVTSSGAKAYKCWEWNNQNTIVNSSI